MAGWAANREIGIKFKTSSTRLASSTDLMSGILFVIFYVNFIRGIRCQISDLWYSMFTRCICLVWCLRYLSLEIVSGHPPFLKNRHSTPWSTFLASQKSSSSISAASVSPHPYKVLYPDLTFLMFTLFSKIWFSSLLLVHLSLSLSIVPKVKVPSLSIFVLTFWKLKGIVPKIARDSFDFPWCDQIFKVQSL